MQKNVGLKMRDFYEVIHCNKTKYFEEKEPAIQHAQALETLGYPVEVKLVVLDLFIESKVTVYKSLSEVV